MLKNADKLALVVGPDAAVLHDLVRHPPPGSENLLLKMLYSLTGARPRVRGRPGFVAGFRERR